MAIRKSRQKPPYPTGTVMGCYQVLEFVSDAPKTNGRLYNVQAVCCNEISTITGQALWVSAYYKKSLCQHCQDTKVMPLASLNKTYFQPGEVVGPVTIIDFATLHNERLVKWSCCGKQSVLGFKRLRTMRLRAQDGQECVCRVCTDIKRKANKLRTESPWFIATAVLPPGVMSAAIAWPKPGARA